MKRLLAILIALAITASATALTVYKSIDGNLYVCRDSSTGPTWEPVKVLPMPSTDTPTDPDDPGDPGDPDDKWGLTQWSRAAYQDITPYTGIQDDAFAIGAMYHLVADQIGKGAIVANQVEAALTIARDSGARSHKAAWTPWGASTTGALKSTNVLGNNANTAQAVHDIARGLGVAPQAETENQLAKLKAASSLNDAEQQRLEQLQQRAIDWKWILEFFITYILPLLLGLPK